MTFYACMILVESLYYNKTMFNKERDHCIRVNMEFEAFMHLQRVKQSTV